MKPIDHFRHIEYQVDSKLLRNADPRKGSDAEERFYQDKGYVTLLASLARLYRELTPAL